MADVAVDDHLVDDPVAALQRAVCMLERMVVVGAFRQGGQIRGFRDRQLIDRLVEIGERRAGNAIGAEAEEDLVEVEFEDTVL